MVSVLEGEVMGPDGFQLSVTLTEVHLPRMWVEKHPDKDTEVRLPVHFLPSSHSAIHLVKKKISSPGLHVGFLSRL